MRPHGLPTQTRARRNSQATQAAATRSGDAAPRRAIQLVQTAKGTSWSPTDAVQKTSHTRIPTSVEVPKSAPTRDRNHQVTPRAPAGAGRRASPAARRGGTRASAVRNGTRATQASGAAPTGGNDSPKSKAVASVRRAGDTSLRAET